MGDRYLNQWQQLVELARPDCDWLGEWAKIALTDNDNVVIMEWGDGSSATLYFKDGEWRFASSPPYDAATATGMYDRY